MTDSVKSRIDLIIAPAKVRYYAAAVGRDVFRVPTSSMLSENIQRLTNRYPVCIYTHYG